MGHQQPRNRLLRVHGTRLWVAPPLIIERAVVIAVEWDCIVGARSACIIINCEPWIEPNYFVRRQREMVVDFFCCSASKAAMYEAVVCTVRARCEINAQDLACQCRHVTSSTGINMSDLIPGAFQIEALQRSPSVRISPASIYFCPYTPTLPRCLPEEAFLIWTRGAPFSNPTGESRRVSDPENQPPWIHALWLLSPSWRLSNSCEKTLVIKWLRRPLQHWQYRHRHHHLRTQFLNGEFRIAQ